MPFKDEAARKAYSRAYYLANRQKQIERATEWNAAHREERSEARKKWYAAHGAEYRASHREMTKAIQRRWYGNHLDQMPAKNRVQAMRQKYGLTVGQYEAMLATQDGVCGLCGKAETHRSRNGEITRLAVDHNHATGSIRALLCHSCNVGIGSFYDDPVLLLAAAEYVKR